MQESIFLEKILRLIKKIIPKRIFKFFQPFYHYLLTLLGAIIYGFPAKKMLVLTVTGTKGKSTTTEILNSIFEEAGYKTVLLNTIRYKIGNKEWRNLSKMSTRGRFFIQQTLKKGLEQGCNCAILEISSEATLQFRHKFLFPDALIFTNLAPEHIESHGSYENYVNAKLNIARELIKSPKSKPVIIANGDDKESVRFLSLNIKNKISYSLKDAFNIKADNEKSSFQIDKTVIYSKLPGEFNIQNMLGAIACARHFGVSMEIIKSGLEKIEFIRGRMQKIEAGQNFEVVVDYAHTPDSLKAIYETYKNHQTICVLGNTGGGRDSWKRPEMAKIADHYCTEIILTNEDPYDEDPKKIIEEMRVAIKNKPCEVIIDRREAIKTAILKATNLLAQGESDKNNLAVLITGKGTDPYIMGPNGTKIEWDDATVVREELKKIK
jgi:UDP-N-acetylmuramoyl-L-alanyl-D-glutamate--2,6-diaminopimelate ligase